MSQGKVIAVKPLGYAGGADFMKLRSTEAATSSSSKSNAPQKTVLYLILNGEEDSVFWHEDEKGKFKKNQSVTFDINSNNSRPISEAINVKKIEGGKIFLPKDFLSLVALTASALLIVAVVLNNRR